MRQDIYLIAVDQGSSGTMSALFDGDLRQVDCVDIPVSVATPRYGWVEQDPWELLNSVRDGAKRLMERNPECLEGLAGIGLANQGESFLLWDTQTGEPVTPVISWQDSRSENYCAQLKQEGRGRWFHERTGLHLSSEWPALKVRELRRSDEKLDLRCRSGRIAFGQLDAWFLYVLTGHRRFASDHGTACRTGFYNLRQGKWDEELIEFFCGDSLIFPELTDNVCRIEGLDLGIGKEIPWIAGGLDQSVTLIGQGCTQPADAKVTYGTCCACWMNLGSKLVLDENLTTSIAWKIGEEYTYGLAAEGGASGSIVTWLLRNFSTDWRQEDLSQIARSYDDQESLLFVPAFGGLSAPYWKEAKGTLFGITAGTRPEHILRAGLDAVAYTVRDILDCMPLIKKLVLDGGMSANEYLVQKQANVLQRPVEKSLEKEGTLLGIAHLCTRSLGVRAGIGEETKAEIVFPEADGQDGYRKWKQAVKTVITYYNGRGVIDG